MRKLRAFCAIGSAVSLFGLNATIAQAEIVEQIYKGNISGISSQYGGVLTIGAPVTATFIFDTSRGNYFNNGVYTAIEGGTNSTPPASDPLIDATISVGSEFGQKISGTQFSSLYSNGEYYGLSETLSYAGELVPAGDDYITGQALAFGNVFQTSLTTPFFYSGPFAPDTVIEFGIDYIENVDGLDRPVNYEAEASITSVQEIAPVPDMPAWAMMTLGFASVGAALRTKFNSRPRAAR